MIDLGVPDRGGNDVDPTVLTSLGEWKLGIWTGGPGYDMEAVGAV